MINSLFFPLRVAAAFSVLFLWHLLPHRYPKFPSAVIAVSSYLAAGFFDYVISMHVAQDIDATGVSSAFAEFMVFLCTAMILGEHRDSRAIFVGMCAATYSLAALMVGSLVYFYTQNVPVAIVSQVAFNAAVLWGVYAENRKTPLAELLANEKSRLALCLVPMICAISIFTVGVFPGNLFSIPVCRPLMVIILVIVLLFCYLVTELLRIQSRSIWLSSNNELLDAYASSLKQQMEHLEKARTEVSILRHDIRHRANLVEFYLDSGNTDGIRKMLADTNAKLDAATEKRFCLNTTLNWVLLRTAQKAEDSGVSFRCAADIGPLPSDMEFEIGVVTLNLLENAVRAAAALPEEERRYVRFSARPVKGQLFLETENPYNGDLHISADTGLPLTRQGGEHGYGLRSVLAFSKKSGSSFDCETADGLFRVILLIPV